MLENKKCGRQVFKFKNNTSVYLGGLPPQTTYWELRTALAEFGELRATFISSLRPYQAHKYGFGCFKSRQSLNKLLAAENQLIIHGAVISVRRRLKSDWQRDNEESGQKSPGSPLTISKDDHSEELDLVNSDQTFAARYPSLSLPLHTMNSPTPPSPFVHPPEFTEYVHDTLASKYRTQGKLQAALKAHPELPVKELDNKNHSDVIGVDSGGRVTQVDGIPATWEAIDLFHFLVDHSMVISSVLVYDDFDERGLRQGLIQFKSSQDALYFCNIGGFQSFNIRLEFARSAIQSIGPVRESYAGRFSAYSREVPTTEAYGYSVAEPFEPSADVNVRVAPPGIAMTIWPNSVRRVKNSTESQYSAATESSVNDLETPGTVVGSGSPLTKPVSHPSDEKCLSDTVEAVESAHKEVQFPTSLFSSKHGHRDNKLGLDEQTGELSEVPCKCPSENRYWLPPNAPFCSPQHLPALFPKASQTVIVDNFDSRLVGDTQNLCNWVSQFGQVQSLDLVPLDNYRTRAYISYMSPIDAQFTMYHLQMCMSGSFCLTVRLA